MLEISTYQNGEQLLVRLKGRIILDECDRLKSTVTGAVTSATRQINLDLSEVDFVDSAGLGALVGIKVSANKFKAKLSLLSPGRGVQDILMVSKLDSLFDLVTGEEAERTIKSLAKEEYALGSGASEAPKPPKPATPAMPSDPAGTASGPPQPAGSGQDAARIQLDQLCRQALEHMRQGDYESAVVCYERAIGIDPTYMAAQNNLAIAYERRPDWQEKAIAQWERVLEMSREANDQKHVDRAVKHLQALQQKA